MRKAAAKEHEYRQKRVRWERETREARIEGDRRLWGGETDDLGSE